MVTEAESGLLQCWAILPDDPPCPQHLPLLLTTLCESYVASYYVSPMCYAFTFYIGRAARGRFRTVSYRFVPFAFRTVSYRFARATLRVISSYETGALFHYVKSAMAQWGRITM